MELPADFLSLGRRSCQFGIRAVLGDSSPVFHVLSIVFPIKKNYNDFPIATYIVLLILSCIKY